MSDRIRELPQISDEDMQRRLAGARQYTVALLKRGPAYDRPRSDPIIWEHVRRNFALRAAGVLAIVCPINDGSSLAGVGIFAADATDTQRILAGDPAVVAGVLKFEVHPSRSFPGDSLPAV